MGFQLVPYSVTLDDLERLKSHNGRIISANSVAFMAYYIKVVEYTPVVSAAEMSATESNFQRYIIYSDIGRDHPQRER